MGVQKPMVLVAGAGAGLGQSLLSRFADGGFEPVGLGRSAPDAPVGQFHTVDLSDETSAPDILAKIIAENGPYWILAK